MYLMRGDFGILPGDFGTLRNKGIYKTAYIYCEMKK